MHVPFETNCSTMYQPACLSQASGLLDVKSKTPINHFSVQLILILRRFRFDPLYCLLEEILLAKKYCKLCISKHFLFYLINTCLLNTTILCCSTNIFISYKYRKFRN